MMREIWPAFRDTFFIEFYVLKPDTMQYNRSGVLPEEAGLISTTNCYRTVDKRLIKISKFLSLVLRHKPETIGINLDPNGWVGVDELLAAVNANGPNITRELLDEVVATNDKQRFSYSADREKIRASQGHSIDIDLDLTPVKPPSFLYHGTVKKMMGSIEKTGLDRMNRQYVHLSPDIETAEKVGQRRGKPVILVIDAGKMHKDGHQFFLSDNGVWLTQSVPREYIAYLDV